MNVYYPTFACAALPPCFAPPSPACKFPRKAPRGYARPTPAPPSAGPVAAPKNGNGAKTPKKAASQPPVKSPEPPLIKGPVVTDSPPYFEYYPVTPRAGEKLIPNQCMLKFWNLSPTAITLKVDSKFEILAKGKSLQILSARQFRWQVGDRQVETVKVPDNESALEIVIRR